MLARKVVFCPLIVVLFALCAGLTGCSDDVSEPDVDAGAETDAMVDPTLPPVDCAVVPGYAEMTVVFYCTGCHNSNNMGGDRRGAPVGVDYDNHAVAMVNAEAGVRRIYAGTMPPGGNDHISQEDKDAFYNWALCGTPE